MVEIILILLMLNLSTCEDLTELYRDFIKESINNTLMEIQNNLSENCYNSFKSTIDTSNLSYLTKLVKNSGFNKNDLTSYEDCLTQSYSSHDNCSRHILQNITYVFFQITKNNSTAWFDPSDNRYETGNYLFGVCVIKGCSKDELILIFKKMKINEIDTVDQDHIKVYDLEDGKIEYNLKYFLSLLPLLVCLMISVFTLIPSIPIFLFRNCWKSIEGSLIYYDETILNYFSKCFNIDENVEFFN
jgi:hypothetical protein